jgi:D-galactarolactone isomerase
VGPVITDTHIHIYDRSFPTAAAAVVRADDASVSEYIEAFPATGGVVVVQPSAYGLDNRCQLDAMIEFERLGVAARGVMAVNAQTTLAEIERLDARGVRGARFHMLPGGAVPWDDLEPVAERIAQFGWHVQLQLNGRELPERVERLGRLPTDIVVDHVGRFMPPVAVESEDFGALLVLLDARRTWVKLSAPYESSPDLALIEPLAAALIERHPDRLLWASNWPHPGRDRSMDVWVPDGVDEQILVNNPARLYGF